MLESYNFSPGPAMLPRSVLEKAKEQLLDFKGGMSAMEISHRHPFFLDLLAEVNQKLSSILSIPSNYKIIWATAGATGQFALAPLNLLAGNFTGVKNNLKVADYFATGYWSKKAMKAASTYVNINKVVDNSQHNYTFIEEPSSWQFSENPEYIYYTPNETISGLKFCLEQELFSAVKNLSGKARRDIPIVADMTSCILSEPVDISQYGVIFAAAQKNLGPSGITLVIIREDLLVDSDLPDVFNYKVLADSNSLVNTPPTYNLSIINLMLDWLADKAGQDGLGKIKEQNIAKAQKLYDYIDASNIYVNSIVPEFRSLMNVTFDFNDDVLARSDNLRKLFITEAEQSNLYSLEGHRSFGGFRASIYNAMPEEGVSKLIDFMKYFADKYK